MKKLAIVMFVLCAMCGAAQAQIHFGAKAGYQPEGVLMV